MTRLCSTVAPNEFISLHAAAKLPPVANKSSTTRTFVPAGIALDCISNTS